MCVCIYILLDAWFWCDFFWIFFFFWWWRRWIGTRGWRSRKQILRLMRMRFGLPVREGCATISPMPWASFTYFSVLSVFHFLHGSVDFCFVWLLYNLLEFCRDCFVVWIFFFFFFWLWIACKRVWLGFWWWTCVMWSQIIGKICWYLFFYNWCEIIKAEKEREKIIF